MLNDLTRVYVYRMWRTRNDERHPTVGIVDADLVEQFEPLYFGDTVAAARMLVGQNMSGKDASRNYMLIHGKPAYHNPKAYSMLQRDGWRYDWDSFTLDDKPRVFASNGKAMEYCLAEKNKMLHK